MTECDRLESGREKQQTIQSERINQMYTVTYSHEHGVDVWVTANMEDALSTSVNNMIEWADEDLPEPAQKEFFNHVWSGELQKAFDCYNKNCDHENFEISPAKVAHGVFLADLQKRVHGMIESYEEEIED